MFNQSKHDEFDDEFKMILSALIAKLNQGKSAPTPQGKSRNRIAQYLNLNPSPQVQESVTVDDFLMQVVVALKDMFADCYITIEERTNVLSIQLSNNEFFYLQITKDNESEKIG